MKSRLRRAWAQGLMLLWASSSHAAADASAPRWIGPVDATLILDVLIANDGDFPAVTAQDAAVILEQAQTTLADKLGFTELAFRIVGHTNIEDFFTRSLAVDGSCTKRLAPFQVGSAHRSAHEVPKDAVQRFLSRWSEDELRAFFPKVQQAGLATYDDIRDRLLTELDRKIALIRTFRLSNGKSLLAAEKTPVRSYVGWICAVEAQNEADLILTNTFALYDLGSEPFPHSVFQKCKVGGASLRSPHRQAMRGRAMMASTFSMITDLPFFRETDIETLTAHQRLQVIGAFIVAHELGHALFKLPDFYDHPAECLMTTKYETGYVTGFHTLAAHPGQCPACEPYVTARRHLFKADQNRRDKRYANAIDGLKKVIKTTPKHIDGSYPRYVVDLSVEIAELYAELDDHTMARRWLASALRLSPEHPRARRLKKRLSDDAKSLKSKGKTESRR